MIRRLIGLCVSVLAVWAVAASTALVVEGRELSVRVSVAAGLCLVPACGTLLLHENTARHSPHAVLLGVLAGTVVRMLVVLAAALLLFFNVDRFHHESFLLWVVSFYWVTLVVETAVVLKGLRRRTAST